MHNKGITSLHSPFPTLHEETPDVVILHAGINDFLSRQRNKIPDKDIAKEFINIGQTCMKAGVKTVFVSSIVYCDRVEWNRIEKINEEIKILCAENNFVYIDNESVKSIHLWRDDIHLNEDGKDIIANNFIDNIRKTLKKTFFRPVFRSQGKT